MTYRGIALWNYLRDDEEQIQRLAERLHTRGFDAISYNGREFSQIDDAWGERLARLLKETGMKLTVHYLLPDPFDPKKCEDFKRGIDHMAAWQKKYGRLHILSFDVWYDKARLMPYLRYALDAMRGLNVSVCCEDFPLTKDEDALLQSILRPDDRYGMLIDLGHMNLRQTKAGKHAEADFIEAFHGLKYPVLEVHIHDNLGEKDDHRRLGYGTLPLSACCRGLRDIGFDGVGTVEIIQRGWPLEEGISHAVDTMNKFETTFGKGAGQ